MVSAKKPLQCALRFYPCVAVNELRYIYYSEPREERSSQDGFLLVKICANYQAGMWRRALEECRSIPNQNGHGWWYEDGTLTIC